MIYSCARFTPDASRLSDRASSADSWYLSRLGVGDGEERQPDARPVVAVLDCGVDFEHPAFGTRVQPGRNFDSCTAEPRPDAGPGASHHGTLAALLAVGDGFGVAPAAHLLPVRFTGDRLGGWRDSLRWAAEHADVVLCPWVLDAECAAARELAGVLADDCFPRALFVCAVGNRAHTVGFPACLPGALGVGAHTSESERAGYSGCGRGLDVLAPGTGGRRRLPPMPVYRVRGAAHRPAGVCSLGGTSAAAALAAGAAARVLAAHPGLSAPQLLDLLRRTARPLTDGPARPWSAADGFGRLDCAAALALAASKPHGATP